MLQRHGDGGGDDAAGGRFHQALHPHHGDDQGDGIPGAQGFRLALDEFRVEKNKEPECEMLKIQENLLKEFEDFTIIDS